MTEYFTTVGQIIAIAIGAIAFVAIIAVSLVGFFFLSILDGDIRPRSKERAGWVVPVWIVFWFIVCVCFWTALVMISKHYGFE